MRGWLARLAIFLAFGLVVPAVAYAAPADSVTLPDGVYAKAASALTILFVTALVLESAFSAIFNWRVFLTYFSARGVKTIIMVVVAIVVVYIFNLDVVASLITAFKTVGTVNDAAFAAQVEANASPVSKFITALVLAGGSAGIYNLMVALGVRSAREAEVEPKPPADEAWVAVRVRKVNAVGEVQVAVSKVTTLPAGETAPPAIAGSIAFVRPRLKHLLLRNIDRFPPNGGYVVEPNVPYEVVVEGKDARGTVLKKLHGRYYVFAPRAIVDFQVDL